MQFVAGAVTAAHTGVFSFSRSLSRSLSAPREPEIRASAPDGDWDQHVFVCADDKLRQAGGCLAFQVPYHMRVLKSVNGERAGGGYQVLAAGFDEACRFNSRDTLSSRHTLFLSISLSLLLSDSGSVISSLDMRWTEVLWSNIIKDNSLLLSIMYWFTHLVISVW